MRMVWYISLEVLYVEGYEHPVLLFLVVKSFLHTVVKGYCAISQITCGSAGVTCRVFMA